MRAGRLSYLLFAAATLAFPSRGLAQDTVRAIPGTWGAAPTVGTDTASVYFLRNGNRQLGITYVETISATSDGFLLVQRNVRPNGALVTLDSISMAKETLAPLWHADVTPRGSMRVSFAGGRMRGSATDTAGVVTVVDTTVPPGALDFSVAGSFVRLLPLRADYAAVLLSYDIHRGVIYTSVRVDGEEDIEIGGTRAQTWKVAITNGGRTTQHWIDQRTRRELRVTVDMGSAQMIMERKPAR